jgi:ribosomal protein L37AE/L43A
METGMDFHSPGITRAETRPFMKAVRSFFLRLFFLIFLTADFSGILVYFLIFTQFNWADWIPTILAVFCGLSAGVLSRFIFTGAPHFIRWLLAAVTSAAVLAGAGYAGDYWLHFDLTAYRLALVKPDFFILTGIGTVISMMAVFAWSRKPKVEVVERRDISGEESPIMEYAETPSIRKAAEHKPAKLNRKRSVSIFPDGLRKRTIRKSNWHRWNRKVSKNWNGLVKFFRHSFVKPIQQFLHPGARVVITGQRKAEARLQIPEPDHRTIPPASLPVNLPRKHSGRKMPHSVRLTGKEEMKCPYCLQPINPRDKNGIVVCPICHSAHHKECWDITGSCQVPHNHAML